MSIRLEVQPAGHTAPVVVCDHCNAAIPCAGTGHILWLEDCRHAREVGGRYEVNHTHAWCGAAFEVLRPAPDGWRWMRQGLSLSLFTLLLHCDYQPQDARREAMRPD